MYSSVVTALSTGLLRHVIADPQETLKRSRIFPNAFDPLESQPAFLSIAVHHVRDLQLAAMGRCDFTRERADKAVANVQPYHGHVALWLPRLFRDGHHAPVRVELHDTVAAWVRDFLAEYRSTAS